MDPVTLGVLGSAGASLYGAISGGSAQNKALAAQNQRYNQLSGLVQGQLQTGTNPYADMITKFAQGLGNSPNVATYGAANAALPGGPDTQSLLSGSGFNTGQDSMMQMMRRQLTPGQDPTMSANLAQQASGNTAFDNSGLFAALAPMDQANMNQQVAALRGQARSLGQLAGSSSLNAEAMLRSQMANATGARNAGLQQQSYESAQQRAMQALGLQGSQLQANNQFNLGAFGQQAGLAQGYMQGGLQAAGLGQQAGLQGQQLGAQIGLANAAGQNQAGQFNAGQFNQYGQMNNAMILQALGQAGGLQGQQQGQNLQALGILGGMQAPGVPQSQIPGALGDMSQLLMMYPFLRQMQGGAGGGMSGAQALGNIGQMPFGYLGQIGSQLQMPQAPAMGWNGFGGGGF